MKQLLTLTLLLLVASAARAEHPVCPRLADHPSLTWDSSLQTFLSETAWLCHAKNEAGETVLSSFSTIEPGNSTYGSNFRAITSESGHSIVWFSDRDADGKSQGIARSYFSTGNTKFPVMMVWFKFDSQDEFNRKAALASMLQAKD